MRNYKINENEAESDSQDAGWLFLLELTKEEKQELLGMWRAYHDKTA